YEITGYHFTGWQNAEGTAYAVNAPFSEADRLSGSITLYAQWEPNTYTVIYHNGTETRNQTATYDQVLTLLGSDTFTKTGWTLKGWARTDGATVVSDNFGATFENNELYVDATRTFDLYAVWEIKTYDVTLTLPAEDAGYTLTGEAVQQIDYLGTVTYVITLDEAHTQTLPENITVTKTANSDVTLTKEGNVITVTVRSTDVGNIEVILGKAPVNTYTVTFVNEAGETVNLVNAPANTVEWGKSVTVEITLPAAYSNTDRDALVTSTGDVTVSHTGSVTYTVAGIKEDITVTLHAATINTYAVGYELNTGVGYTVDTEPYENVTHGTDVTFTITLNEAYTDSAAPAATLKDGFANATLILPTSKVNNTYTYTLHNVTGNTTLVLGDAVKNTYTVDLSATKVGYTVIGAEQFQNVEYGTSVSFIVKLDEAFSASPAPAASLLNGKATLVGPTGENGEFTYTLNNVTGNETLILGDATRNTYSVTASKGEGVVGIESVAPAVTDNVAHGTGTVTITVTLEDAYSDSDAPAVALTDETAGNAEISGGVKSVVGGKTVYTYTVTNVTGPADFTVGSASPNKYIVSFDATRVGYAVTTAPASFVYYMGTATAVITLEEGYSQSATPACTVTNGDLTVERSGNVITYTVANITANTSINIGSAAINRYDVELQANGTGYIVREDPSGENVVEHGGSKTVKIELATAYSDSPIPTIEVVNGNGDPIGSAIGSKVGNEITYTVTNITDDVIIRIGPATKNTYTVAVRPGDGAAIRLTSTSGVQDFFENADLTRVEYGTTYTVSLTDSTATTRLYVNGVEITAGTEITVTSNLVISTDALEYIATFLNYDRTYWASYIVVRNNYPQCYKGDPTREDSTYHHYVFTGWLCDDEGVTLSTPMTADRVFVAQYDTYHQNLVLMHDETGHWYECPECGYREGYEGRAHVAGETVTENYVAPTCTSTGGYDSVVYCAVCGYEMERTYVFLDYDFNNHTDPDTHEPNDTYRVMLYDATCVDTGLYGIYCVKCDGLIGFEEIPINPDHHHWSSYTYNDDDSHTRTCELCGAVENEHHILREVYRVAATCVDDGITMYGCTVCGSQINKVRHATGEHKRSDPYIENYVAGTCQTKESYDLVTYCETCGQQLDRTHVEGDYGEHRYEIVDGSEIVPATCTGTYHAEYKCAVCGDTYEVNETGEHVWGGWTVTEEVTATTDGKEVRTCEICGETEERTISHETFKPMGERQVQFIEQDGVTYLMLDYKTNAESTVSGYVKYYSNVELRFKVNVDSHFSYRGYSVYVNGNEVMADGNGVYTVPAGVETIHITVSGVSPIDNGDNNGDNGGDNGGNNGGNNGSSESGSCPYCHQNHTGFFGGIVGFFHRIAYFFSNLFSR
ncbi:MAG: hypothetical protein IK104_11525, partial [Clostridia bacterium]|nr:hypothetical protein [Clostridia bacterium]